MKELLERLNKIKDEAKPLVEARYSEFKELGKNGNEEDLFSELSFCVLTANWSAQGGIKAQKIIGNGFLTLEEKELENKLKECGHRYPQARANYIVRNRWLFGKLGEVINKDPYEARQFLVDNVVGLSWKESSHFLRNCGIDELAILDKHVMRLMISGGLLEELPKSGWTKKKYSEIENKLLPLSQAFGEVMGKFDLYLWYLAKNVVDK